MLVSWLYAAPRLWLQIVRAIHDTVGYLIGHESRFIQ